MGSFSEISPALRFLAAAGIAWLITLYLVYENGPPLPRIGPVFLWLRKRAGFRPKVAIEVDGCTEKVPVEMLPPDTYCPDEIIYAHDGQFFARMLSCHRCAGFWIGMIVGLALFGLSWAGLALAAGATGISIAAHEFMPDIEDTRD